MTNFGVRRITTIRGKIEIFSLLIDGRNEFEDFCDQLERQKEDKAIGSIFATLESYANCISMPKTRFRELQGRKRGTQSKIMKLNLDHIGYIFSKTPLVE